MAKALRVAVITAYQGAGLTPKPIDFSLPSSDPKDLQSCFWYVKISNRLCPGRPEPDLRVTISTMVVPSCRNSGACSIVVG